MPLYIDKALLSVPVYASLSIFLMNCIKLLAGMPERTCPDGRDNAGQNCTASVVRRVGGFGCCWMGGRVGGVWDPIQ